MTPELKKILSQIEQFPIDGSANELKTLAEQAVSVLGFSINQNAIPRTADQRSDIISRILKKLEASVERYNFAKTTRAKREAVREAKYYLLKDLETTVEES